MTAESAKHVIALYVRYFLSPSETFVYRQLEGISGDFDPIVLASAVHNADLYPVDRLYAKPKDLPGKIYTRLKTIVGGRFSVITSAQRRYWTDKLVEHGVRLIHAHFGHFGMDMLDIASGLDIPLLVTFHGMDASELLNNKRYTNDLKGLFDHAHVITISQNMATRLEPFGLDLSRLHVHYIGVPINEFGFVRRMPVAEKIAKGEPVVFLQVSNFVEKKGHSYTVDAFTRHLDEFPGHRLILAGDGPLRGEIESRCIEKGIADRVEFKGRVVKTQIVELMRDADVFLHHSVTGTSGDMEGIPTVIMEAMSTGLVCISTVHSGIPELIDHGVNGFLVCERDVDAYVKTLNGLSGCDHDLPVKARAKIEDKFNMAVQNKRLGEIYEKVINERVV